MARQDANLEELNKALKELGLEGQVPVEQLFAHAKQYQAEVERKLDAKMPKFHRNYWWNAAENMKVQMKPTRLGFGQSLAANGDDPRIVCFGLDISAPSPSANSMPEARAQGALDQHGHRRAIRHLSCCRTCERREASRLRHLCDVRRRSQSRSDSYLDLLRQLQCPNRRSSRCVSVGPDGATHQALEDCFAMCGLPNMNVVVPCDIVETRKATDYLLLKHVGPKYIRFAAKLRRLSPTKQHRLSSAKRM